MMYRNLLASFFGLLLVTQSVLSIEYEAEYIDTLTDVQLYKLYKDKIFYVKNSELHGREWFTHELKEKEEPKLFKDIKVGASSSIPNSLTEEDVYIINDKLFFHAADDATGIELWVSDGTSDNTKMIKDLEENDVSQTELGKRDPQQLNMFGNEVLFFISSQNIDGVWELWSTDGTEEGTRMIKNDIGSLPQNAKLLSLVANETFYFTTNQAPPNSNLLDLWKTDGSEEGTQIVMQNYEKTLDAPLVLKNNIYFIEDKKTLIKVVEDAQPEFIKAINQTDEKNSLHFAQTINDKMYFAINDGQNGREIWTSDGTEDNTQLLKDINLGVSDAIDYDILYSNKSLPVIDGILYFPASDADNGMELWYTDGSSDNTKIVDDLKVGSASSSPKAFYPFESQLYFVATNEDGRDAVYRTSPQDKSDIELVISNFTEGVGVGYTIKEILSVGSDLYFILTESNNTILYKMVESDENEIDSLQDFFVGGVVAPVMFGLLIMLWILSRAKNRVSMH